MDCDSNKNTAGENAYTINALCQRVLYIAPQTKHVHCIIIDVCQEEESSPEQENSPLRGIIHIPEQSDWIWTTSKPQLVWNSNLWSYGETKHLHARAQTPAFSVVIKWNGDKSYSNVSHRYCNKYPVQFSWETNICCMRKYKK